MNPCKTCKEMPKVNKYWQGHYYIWRAYCPKCTGGNIVDYDQRITDKQVVIDKWNLNNKGETK